MPVIHVTNSGGVYPLNMANKSVGKNRIGICREGSQRRRRRKTIL